MKYIREFENYAAYAAAESGLILPNVSLCTQENEVYYNPLVFEKRVVAKYNVTDTSNPTQIGYYSYINGFSTIEIDGVAQPSVVSAYTFSTTGEHTVKYTLTDQTNIGSYAFDGCSGLTSITIPNNVTSIGNNAFDGCSGLTSIEIPSGVTSIGDNVFYKCSNSLTSITVNSNNTVYDSRNSCNAIIKTINNELVLGCKNTVIPNNVTSIGDYAFDSCSGLTSIEIPNSVTSIGSAAFQNCSGLTSVTIGSGVTSIGGSAFNSCSSLTSIEIPSGVTSIGSYGFGGCSGLTSITSLATTGPTIKNNTFYGVRRNGTLRVPVGSSDYDVWMRTSAYYLGYYNWTKVEQ